MPHYGRKTPKVAQLKLAFADAPKKKQTVSEMAEVARQFAASYNRSRGHGHRP